MESAVAGNFSRDRMFSVKIARLFVRDTPKNIKFAFIFDDYIQLRLNIE
jgi:hypothetical protein